MKKQVYKTDTRKKMTWHKFSEEELEFVPYGCTQLRVSMFPYYQ